MIYIKYYMWDAKKQKMMRYIKQSDTVKNLVRWYLNIVKSGNGQHIIIVGVIPDTMGELDVISKALNIHAVCLNCKNNCKRGYSSWNWNAEPIDFCKRYQEDSLWAY